MKKISLALMLAFSFGAAQASSLNIANQSAVFGFSGYDGQPASVTGTKKFGETGTLVADTHGTISFTYLGQESGFLDSLKLNLGGGTLTETLLGTTISKVINAGTVGFSFMDDVNHDLVADHTFANGTLSTGAFGYVFLMDRSTVYGSAHNMNSNFVYDFAHNATITTGPNQGKYTFDYLLGFNDSYVKGPNVTLGDSDYDDYVVGVNFTPSPVPLPAAAWLFGSALLGFSSLTKRRKI